MDGNLLGARPANGDDPEVFLASSEDVQGLVAQGRTIAETLEIARDVARRLLDAQAERETSKKEPPPGWDRARGLSPKSSDLPI